MRILNILQKKQNEKSLRGDASETLAAENNLKKRRRSKPPELFSQRNSKVQARDAVFNKPPASIIVETLPDLETENLAEVAAPSAFEQITVEEKRLPEFIVWNVEPERVNPRLVAITEPYSTYCEEYRSLRTRVLHQSQQQKLQSIVIASVAPSEGKSITALNLAWMLAQADGVRALIIDADLRMPSLGHYLGIEAEKGLSDVLAEKFSFKDSIIRLEPAGLHLLPSGAAISDVAELISGTKFREILEEASEMFDYVIIDAPPLGIFTDATVLINQADGALLVVRANQTRYEDVTRILETLPREKILGGVLNQSEVKLNNGYYDYGYYK